MRPFNRAVIIVFDGLGIGELPDAASYGDSGSHTLDNLSRAVGGLRLPVLASLGLGCIEGVSGVERGAALRGSYGRMGEASPGKDTATGHWEMMGVVLKDPFPVFPDGFTGEMLERFTLETGWGWLWGRTASGTEIMDRLGEEHLSTRRLIVYTSADSVFQIAAHEDVISPEELYRVCLATRRTVADEYNIGRVIARPFTGRPGAFERLPGRKDFPVPPPSSTVLDAIDAAGLASVGIGKIGDIFAHRGLTAEIHTSSDEEGMARTVEALSTVERGLVFTNLVDFDTLYGHRNDPRGYASALERTDALIPPVLDSLCEDDILFITGDHGCDPTTPSTDHSREYAPILAYGQRLRPGAALGTRKSFADLGATVAEALGLEGPGKGASFLKLMLK